jgi:aminoglycoside phosphotransferase (APT) family kinase protein
MPGYNAELPAASGEPDFVSKMHMHSQETPQDVIDEERSIIRAELDLSESDEIIFDDEGWDSRVYSVAGGETFYKFSRSPEVRQGYAREIAALGLLGSIESDVVTQQFRHLDTENRYFSYRGILGTQLSELLETLDPNEKERIGNQIGSFLQQLHTLQMDGAPIVTPTDEIEEYKDKYRLLQPTLATEFSREEQSRIATLFMELMPAEITRLGGVICLSHGDLGSYNVIIGKDGTVGVIDFGNIGYYDQSKDFIDFGDDTVLGAAFEAYGDSPLLQAKTAIRMLALPAID